MISILHGEWKKLSISKYAVLPFSQQRNVYCLAIGTPCINHTAAILEVLHSGVAEDEVSWDVTVCGVAHIPNTLYCPSLNRGTFTVWLLGHPV